jgi:hypothetical protein
MEIEPELVVGRVVVDLVVWPGPESVEGLAVGLGSGLEPLEVVVVAVPPGRLHVGSDVEVVALARELVW